MPTPPPTNASARRWSGLTPEKRVVRPGRGIVGWKCATLLGSFGACCATSPIRAGGAPAASSGSPSSSWLLQSTPRRRLLLHHRARIMDFAAQHRLPGVHGYRELVGVGGLMSYGPSYTDMHRRASYFVDRILSQVSDPLGRRRNESRGGARASRSLMEGSFREDVGSGAQAGVMGWFPSAERMEANRVSIEIEIAADHTMRPQTVYVKAAAEKADRSMLRGAADEDHQTARMSLEILTPTNGKGASRRSRFDAGGSSLAISGDVARRALLEVDERIVMETQPHFGVPAAVEVFDGSLEAAFLGRGEHRSHAKLKTGAYDAAERIPAMMAALKDRVVVELGVGGQPEFSPMLHKCFHRDFGGHQRVRPGARQPAVQRDDVEGLQAHAALQGESLDDVEAVELGPSL